MSRGLGDVYKRQACPSCLAVLAIRPTMLGDADRCPHCGGALVSQALINKYNDEEA